MSKRSILIVSVLFLALADTHTQAQPALPFYDWGAGPCEYCLYGKWTAKKEVPIFRGRDSRSKVAFVTKKDEKLTAVTGVVITTQAGIGKAIQPTVMRKYNEASSEISWVNIRRNETFHILTYHGEGDYTVWFKGQLLEAGLEGAELVTIKAPRFVWWVKIRNSRGQVGWTRMVRNFDGPHEV